MLLSPTSSSKPTLTCVRPPLGTRCFLSNKSMSMRRFTANGTLMNTRCFFRLLWIVCRMYGLLCHPSTPEYTPFFLCRVLKYDIFLKKFFPLFCIIISIYTDILVSLYNPHISISIGHYVEFNHGSIIENNYHLYKFIPKSLDFFVPLYGSFTLFSVFFSTFPYCSFQLPLYFQRFLYT